VKGVLRCVKNRIGDDFDMRDVLGCLGNKIGDSIELRDALWLKFR
jgi:hypothetical protein